MPRTKGKMSVSNRRRKALQSELERGIKIEAIPVKSVSMKTQVAPTKAIGLDKAISRQHNFSAKLLESMDLDEMLEASKILELGLKGERIPIAKSYKVKKYVDKILRLNKRMSTKKIAKKMQQDLTVQIVRRNKNTTNAIEAKHLYKALMKEE